MSSRSEQSPNILDFCVDFSKYEVFRLLDKCNKNQPDPLPLKYEDYILLIEDFTKLKEELQRNLESYKNNYIPRIDKINKERNLVNNQKLKKQTLNPPTNPLNTVTLKDKPQPRNQLETPTIFKNPPTLFQNQPPKIEKHSSNQTSSQTRHHDKKNVSKSTGVERPVRPSNDKINRNSVWYKAETFFQDLPSNEELNKVFSLIDSYVESRKIKSQENLNNDRVVHWTEHMNKYVRSKKMTLVPPPPPDANDISDYWKNNQISFQIEDMQKRSFSIFHHLINSFVELDAPLPRTSFQNSPLSSPSQTEEISTKENNHNEQREPNLIASFSLLPQFASETYMALSFDQRLSLEIESLGLNLPNAPAFKRISPIEDDIKNKINDNDKIVSTLSKMRNNIMSNIDDYRMQQQKRKEMIDESQKILLDLESNSKKEKK